MGKAFSLRTATLLLPIQIHTSLLLSVIRTLATKQISLNKQLPKSRNPHKPHNKSSNLPSKILHHLGKQSSAIKTNCCLFFLIPHFATIGALHPRRQVVFATAAPHFGLSRVTRRIGCQDANAIALTMGAYRPRVQVGRGANGRRRHGGCVVLIAAG